MPTLQLYDKLLQFPLFQGMSHAELMQVATHTKLGFAKLPPGKRVVKADEPCTHFRFLINGTLHTRTVSDDHGYAVEEDISAPYLLQPECLFGMGQRYSSTFTTLTPCNFITIDKQEVLLLMETQLVFRLNLLNIMATETQRLQHRPWRSAPKSLRERIIRFFFSHTLRPAGAKTYYLLMKRLADDLNDSRLSVSKVLNAMQDEQLLTLHRGRIVIPMLERLLMQ